MPELAYDTFLTRIEVIKGNKNGSVESEPTTWRLTLERAEPHVCIISGFYKTVSDAGLGRALVYGVIISRDRNAEKPIDLDFVRESATAEDCVEAMYDTVRRALAVQSSLMDFTYDLPIKAPETEIQLKGSSSKQETSESRFRVTSTRQ